MSAPTPPDDRHRDLQAKRRELQARRERDACRATIAHELAILDASATPYTLIWPKQLRENWIGCRFPWDIGRIDWTAVADSRRIAWRDAPTRDTAFLALLAELSPSPDEALTLVWGNALKPALRLSAAAIRRHLGELLDADFDAWLSSGTGDWLLECYHEGEIAYGRLPS